MRKVCWWSCALALGCCLGCARQRTTAAPVVPVASPDTTKASGRAAQKTKRPDASAYNQGLLAFSVGHLKKAAGLWRQCLATESDPAARQRALFALASVKLLLAGNEGELSLAMDLLETWASNNPPGGSGEDPRFFLALAHAFKPPYVLREQRAAGDKECAKKLGERDQQVRHMQQQVKALETIHREIQEKKKGLATY